MSSKTDAAEKTKKDEFLSKKPTDMTSDQWITSWENQQIGFHLDSVHEMLKKHLHLMLNGREKLRVFIPLCGKAVDMKWLADMGHTVVGVELAELGIKQFFTEHNLTYVQEPVPGAPNVEVFKTLDGRISLFRCDIFDFSMFIAGQFDGIWDRGSLQALSTADRQRYSKLIITLMAKGCQYLLDTLVCTNKDYNGMPPRISEAETRSLYGHACNIQLVDSTDKLTGKQESWGLECFIEEVHLITLKTDSS